MIKKKNRKGNVTPNLPALVYPPGRGLPGYREVIILFSRPLSGGKGPLEGKKIKESSQTFLPESNFTCNFICFMANLITC